MNIKNRVATTYNGIFGPLPSPDKWVFIVGCYNSGTTLLHDLMANHPFVGSMPYEGQVYTDQLVSPKSVGLPRLWATEPDRFYLDENSTLDINVTKLKRQWGSRFDDPRKSVLIEKSPTNAARVRWLQKFFVNAYFIGIVRNGYAVAEGIRRKAGHSLDLAARQWINSNEIMLRDFEALSHQMIITYEALTEDTATTMNAVHSFLALDPNLNAGVKNRLWHVHEQVSPIQNMNERSLSVLTEREVALIESVAGPLLHKLNYSARRGVYK